MTHRPTYSDQMLDELRRLGRSEQWIAEFVQFATVPGSPTPSSVRPADAASSSSPQPEGEAKAQRLLAEYQQRTARVEAMVADNIKRGVYRERPFSRLLLQRPDDVQADWNQADEDQWGNQEPHWQASTRQVT